MGMAEPVEARLKTTLAEIANAASNGYLQDVLRLARWAEKLDEMRRTVVAVEVQLSGIDGLAPQGNQAGNKGDGHRQLVVQVTRGMLKQSFLALTAHTRRGDIAVGEILHIETREGQFTTEVLDNNKLRERGAIGRFYRANGIRAEDFVVLTETSENHWTLRKASNEENQDSLDKEKKASEG